MIFFNISVFVLSVALTDFLTLFSVGTPSPGRYAAPRVAATGDRNDGSRVYTSRRPVISKRWTPRCATTIKDLSANANVTSNPAQVAGR